MNRRQRATGGLKSRTRTLRILQQSMLRRILLISARYILRQTVTRRINIRTLNGLFLCAIRNTAASRRSVLHICNGRFLFKILTSALEKRIRSETLRRLRRPLLRALATRITHSKKVIALTNGFIGLIGRCGTSLNDLRIVINRLGR